MEVRLSSEQDQLLAKLAKQRGADKGAVAAELLGRALEYEDWFIREVEKGRVSLRRGEFVDHDALKARIAKRLQRT
jgi:predicted transcriptional regulator